MPHAIQKRRPLRHGPPAGSRRAATAAVLALGLALTVAVVAIPAWSYVAAGTKLSRAPGQVVPDFGLVDVRTSHPHRLSDYDAQPVVIVFCGTHWPEAQTYLPRLARYAVDLESHRVHIVAINSNASESIDDIVEHARRLRVRFPMLKDPENRVADLLAVERQGEALVIDRRGRLRYRGAIDDQFSTDPPLAKPTHNYLLEAVDAILAGKVVCPDLTTVSSAPIERVRPVE